MNRLKQRITWCGLLLTALAVVVLAQGTWLEKADPTFARMTQQTLIIDPGHGGEDGGAVSVSGKSESQINLASTLREKKVSDLHNRVALINQVENATLISIHQNSSPSPSHRGIQVFYGDEALSLPLAQAIQQTMLEVLSPEKKRAPQHIASSVYLMNHISCRAVLVECGFLSNAEEDRLLQEPAYQMKLAITMAACYLSSGSSQEGESFV